MLKAFALRMVHGKAVVVLAGDDDVFHARILGQLGNLHRIELDGIELLGKLLVLGHGNAGHVLVHDPFADAVIGLAVHLVGQLGIEPPMNEHGVVAVGEQLPALGIFGTELDHGLAPHLVHVLGEGRA